MGIRGFSRVRAKLNLCGSYWVDRVEWRLAGESHFVETRLFSVSLPINPTNHHPSSYYGNQNQAIAYNGYPSITVQGPLLVQEAHERSDENADAKPTKFCHSKDSNGIQGRNGAHGPRRNQRSHSIGRYESWHSPSAGGALDKADAGSKVRWCVTTRTILTSGCDTCITQNKSPSAFLTPVVPTIQSEDTRNVYDQKLTRWSMQNLRKSTNVGRSSQRLASLLFPHSWEHGSLSVWYQ